MGTLIFIDYPTQLNNPAMHQPLNQKIVVLASGSPSASRGDIHEYQAAMYFYALHPSF